MTELAMSRLGSECDRLWVDGCLCRAPGVVRSAVFGAKLQVGPRNQQPQQVLHETAHTGLAHSRGRLSFSGQRAQVAATIRLALAD